MAKQVTITIETNSVVVLHARTSGRVCCRRCANKSEMLNLALPSEEGMAGWTLMQQLIDGGEIHHEQAPDGSSLVCLNSLLAFVHNRSQSRGHSLREINTIEEEI
jgi:hypothetical protein